ncbi:hypothetical protein [Ktedonobacter racemifer]|uniref:PTS system, sucrose-specific IIBC component n=1 Tax=Ktedonobacter racemifer DSM 44963 TaxID=485913 RepID=D6TUH9_KTERA|nr:hypothetical protein [Ktedonobacter racemifer]EFH84047.1 PTS system, sucrose-specific IIBC component [Ktedonobacter racemifer DSM 44963]
MVLHINPLNGIFIGAFIGFLLSLPIGLSLAFWLSQIKLRALTVLGAFLGALIGFCIIYASIGTLLFDPPPIASNPGAAFFGTILFCPNVALAFAIVADVLIANRSTRASRRATHK